MLDFCFSLSHFFCSCFGQRRIIHVAVAVGLLIFLDFSGGGNGLFLLWFCFFTASNDSSSWPVLVSITVEKPDKGDEWENWCVGGGGGGGGGQR